MSIKLIAGAVLSAVGIGIVIYDIMNTYGKIKNTEEKSAFAYIRIIFMVFLFFFFVISLFFANKQEYVVKYLQYEKRYKDLKKDCNAKMMNLLGGLIYQECSKDNIRNVELTAKYYKCMIFGSQEKCIKYLSERRINEFNLSK